MNDLKQRKISKKKNAAVIDEKVNINNDTPKPKVSSLRILSRTVVIFALLTIVYFTSNDEKVKPFALQTEQIPGKGQIVDCSADYLKDTDKFEGCSPRKCKRFVTDKLVSLRETQDLLKLAKKGFKISSSSGGASILDLHSGAISYGNNFVNLYNKEEFKGLFTVEDFNLYRTIKDKIKYSVAHHFELQPDKIYLTYPTFFSQITSKKAVTLHDEYWQSHVDKITYPSFHYTTLLYLSDFNKDFKGGRFVFIDEKYNRTIEPKMGRVSMFTSGAENLHHIEKVTSGERYAITVSFTCDIKFAIEDPTTKKYN